MPEQESSTEDVFQIDTRAEKKYNAKRAAEELKELEEKYADESISITEEESSYEDDPQENEEIKRVIEHIRNKEPKIYDKSATFYAYKAPKEKHPEPDDEPQKEKSYTLKDYYREQILQKMGTEKKKKRIQYDAEQEENVEEFISELIKEEPLESIFVKKEQNLPDSEELELDPENFLQKYVFGGGWKQESPKKDEQFLDEDSEELEIIEEFDKEGLENIPAPVSSKCPSTKRPVQSRKRKELKNKLRNREKEKQKQEEIKRLKNLKKQQFQERIKLLKQVSNLSNRKLAKINLKDEYTEKAFNRMLDSLFNAKYDMKEEKHRPKLSGASVEAQELQEIEVLAAEGEMQRDRKREKEVRKILQQIKELRNDYNSLQTSGSFRYVSLPSVQIGLSALDILSMDDRALRKNYPLKKYAPFQDPEEKRKLQRSLGKPSEEKTNK